MNGQVDPTSVPERAREFAERQGIPYRKALLWGEPYDFEERVDFLSSLPEYTVIETDIGGVIAIEEK